MIKKSTNRSGERRAENLRILENCMELLSIVYEKVNAKFARREEGQRESKPQLRRAILGLLPALFLATLEIILLSCIEQNQMDKQ